MDKPSYYSILTADVRYDKRLGKPNPRELYSEITALSNKDGYCHASNAYFARIYEISTSTVSRWVSLLEECGYIHREVIYRKGTKEVQERRLYPISTPMRRNDKGYYQMRVGGISKSEDTPICRNDKDNNININTINKNIEREKTEENKKSPLDIANENGLRIKSIFYPEFLELNGKLGDELTIEAIRQTVARLKYPSYAKLVDRIESYLANNIQTVEDARRFEEKQSQPKKQNWNQPKKSQNYGFGEDLFSKYD